MMGSAASSKRKTSQSGTRLSRVRSILEGGSSPTTPASRHVLRQQPTPPCTRSRTEITVMTLERGPFVFRVNDTGAGPNLLIQVCMERGWRECSYNNANQRDNWNLWWKTSAFPVSQHKQLKAWQFTNHIPKGASICRKDNLARYLKCMKKVYGAIYDITPHGYNLPLEYTKLVADCSRQREDDNQTIWICKPVGQSQGRGIFLFRELSELCYDSNAVVQKYISNPLLIGGYKFDLRLYVCVPSYHPLTIYLYKEGIVRFSTEKFSLTDLHNPFCHLTNSSLNKLGPGYADQKGGIGAGCKWSLRQLRHHFEQTGVRDWLLWQRIAALVTLTVLSQSTAVPATTNCFEFYGFDVLIDENLKPWLLEVNLSPALGNDCDVDPAVKKPLLHDLFDLLGLPVCNTGLSLFSTAGLQFGSDSPETSNESDESDSKEILSAKSKARPNTCAITNRPASLATSAMIVATAATKWRRKRKPGYLFGPPRRSSIDQAAIRVLETKRPEEKKKQDDVATKPLKKDPPKSEKTKPARKSEPSSIKSCQLPIDKSYLANKGFRGRATTSNAQLLWGNGRDWRYPAADEGDWGRIYPLGPPATPKDGLQTEAQVKAVVLDVTRFLRAAKQISGNDPQGADHELSENLSTSLNLSATVWLPLK